MKRLLLPKAIGTLLAALALLPPPLWACSVCQGEPGAPLSEGLKWGVLALLFVVLTVLAGIAVFFVYLVKRPVAHPEASLASGACRQL